MFAALGPLLEELLASGAAEGAAGGAAEGAAAEGTAAREAAASKPKGSKVEKQIDDFNKLFEDHPSNQPPGGPPNDPGDKKNVPLDPDKLKKLANGLDNFDKQLGSAADEAEKWSKRSVDAINNRFLPIVRDILPENMGRLVGAFANVVDAFIQRGHELSQYSGSLSQAEAVSDLKETLADMRESQALEDPVSRMMTDSTDIWIEIRDILLPLKRAGADILADIMDGIRDLLDAVGPPLKVGIELLSTLVEVTWDLATFQITKAGELLEKLPERLAAALAKKEHQDDDLFEKQIRAMIPQFAAPPVRPAARQGMPPGLGVPALA